MFGSSEGALGVDEPLVAEQDSEPGSEDAWRGQWRQVAVELEGAFAESSFQPGEELTAEDATKHADGKKERRAGRDPAGVVRCESSGGKDAVNVRMKLQALIPGVEHAEESDLGSQVAGIASDLDFRVSALARNSRL